MSSPASSETTPARAASTAAWTGLLVLASYVALYPIHGFRVAIGSDTPVYVWWARYAGVAGIGGLGTRARPGIAGLLAVLSRVTGTSEAGVAEAIAPALAVALALAAAGLVHVALSNHSEAAGHSRRRFALAVVLTGSFLSLMVAGYLSTLAFGTGLVAALAVLAAELEHATTRGLLAAALLLAAAGLAHLLFLALAAAVLAGALVALLPASVRRAQAGMPLRQTGAFRVALASASGAVLAVGVFLAVGGGPPPPQTSRDAVLRSAGLRKAVATSYRRKLRHDFPWYRILTVVGLAATAAIPAGHEGRRASGPRSLHRVWLGSGEERRLLFWGAMLAWLAVSAGSIALLLVGIAAPGQRLAAFCLPLPMLATVGLTTHWKARPTLALAGAVLFAVVAWMAWGQQQPLVSPAAVTQAREAAALLAKQAPGTPIILVVDDRGDKPGLFVTRYANFLRDEVPAGRVPDVHVFVGTVDDFLAHGPTLTGYDEHDALSIGSWTEVRALLGSKPLAVVIQAFDPVNFARAHRAADLTGATGPDGIRSELAAPGVAVLTQYPGSPCETAACLRAARDEGSVGPGPLSPWLSVWLAPALLALLAGLGYPWSRLALQGRDALTIVSLSPAFGVAALSAAAVLADVAGLRLGAGGGWVALGLVLLGWPIAVAGARVPPSVRP